MMVPLRGFRLSNMGLVPGGLNGNFYTQIENNLKEES